MARQAQSDSAEDGSDVPASGWQWQPVQDWSELANQYVEIRERSKIIDAGRVDAVTPDGAVLWLAFDGAASRRIVLKNPETYVRLLHHNSRMTE
jgi:hypothetical protein